MKNIKLYNVIFPLWLILFFPPIIFITLAGNFMIDSLVVIVSFYLYHLKESQISLKTFYKKSILKVWLFGFLADIIGASLLFFCAMAEGRLGLPYEITSAISYNPFHHPAAIAIIVLAMLIVSTFLFFFNYELVFHKLVDNKVVRLKIALTIAIVTIPWTFLLPTEWFYKGF